ncbi:MAG TPA: hypothetical protein VF017_19010 [Thermoanaerobaculia bacterium]|nr:hypothetical protein [Thermoanaerobaculia bacterium]
MSRLEESREKVRTRLREIGDEADRQTARALAVKDAALAILGTVGALIALRGLAKAVSGRKKDRGDRPEKERGPSRRSGA